MRAFVCVALFAACSSEAELRVSVHPAIVQMGSSVEVASDPSAEISVSGLPVSASASFGDATDGRRSMTITGSGLPGEYALVVTARTGDRGASVPLRLLVGSVATTAISVDPAALSIPQGAGVTATVRVTRAFGVDGPIDVFADSAPESIGIAPFTIPAGQSEGALRVSAGPEAKLGPAELVLRAGTSSANVKLDIRPGSGRLDASFGKGGLIAEQVLAQGQSPIYIAAAVRQPDGKLLVVGTVYLGSAAYDFFLVRYEQDGSVDATFGTNGVVTTDLGTSDYDVASAVALQSDGKIVVAGNHAYQEMAVVRYDSSGKLDAGFANGGIFRGVAGTTYSTGALGVAIQSDGAIVASGWSSGAGALLRLTPVGALDPSFANGGILTGPTGAFPSIVVQPDQKIVALGYDASDFLVWRRNANGTADSTFAGTGSRSIDFASGVDKGQTIVVQKDGTLLAGGTVTNGASSFIAIAKLDASGALVSSFGSGGTALVTAAGGNGVTPILVQPDGKILVAGGSSYNGTSSTVLARLTPSGALDPTFDATGIVFVNCGSHDQWWTHLSAQADGRIVAIGFAGDPVKNTVMARFWP